MMLINQSPLLLDACCVFNFLASGHFFDIVKAISVDVYITKTVQEQELINFDGFDPEDITQFNNTLEQGIVKIVDFEAETEADLFINYASILGDDGESATGAIAICRGWAIATDDKRAITLFKQEVPNLQILSTQEIIKYWSEITNIDLIQLKTVLNQIKKKGQYFPPKNDPLRSWWETAIKSKIQTY